MGEFEQNEQPLWADHTIPHKRGAKSSDAEPKSAEQNMAQPIMAEPTMPHKAVQSENTVPHKAVQYDFLQTAEQTIPAPAIRQRDVNRAYAPSTPYSVPHTVTHAVSHTVPHSAPVLPRRASTPHHREQNSGIRTWLLGIGGVGLVAMLFLCAMLTLSGVLLFNGSIFNGVQVAGIAVGGMSEQEATNKLAESWIFITLADVETGNSWIVSPDLLGISLDAPASAQRAYAQGRGEGDIFAALQGIQVAPVGNVDVEQFFAGLESLRAEIEIPALNAGVQFMNGEIVERPAANGRALDLNATLASIRQNGVNDLADGNFDLVMMDTYPAITSAEGMVSAARGLLANPLTIRAYDPVTGDILPWSIPPETWAAWLIAEADASNALGLKFSVDRDQLKTYLQNQAQVFDQARFIDYGYATADVNDALARNETTATVRVYHRERKHTVQSGETIISIAWDYGIPYPWIQQANGGGEALSIGQEITIPSPDEFFQFDPVPDKRIVVSISEQRTRVYENGQLKWDWATSTGITNSPTWPGVYQIISHDPNAYAANWNLWMPYFMGVYQPVPGVDFTNGFHGFPTRGTQLLWEGNLGSRVTYGCIMVSNTNIKQLYDWAEKGVIVEIQK